MARPPSPVLPAMPIFTWSRGSNLGRLRTLSGKEVLPRRVLSTTLDAEPQAGQCMSVPVLTVGALIRQTCGIGSTEKCVYAASSPGQGSFLRHRLSLRGVLCGIGPRKRPPMRHRFREKPSLPLADATARITENRAHQGRGDNLLAWTGEQRGDFGAKNCRLSAG